MQPTLNATVHLSVATQAQRPAPVCVLGGAWRSTGASHTSTWLQQLACLVAQMRTRCAAGVKQCQHHFCAAAALTYFPCAACLWLQEQRIRATHNFKKLSTKVADRITKGLKRGRGSRGGTVAAAAAAGEADGGSSSGGEGNNDTPTGSKAELADLIRKNGEEIATSVETVVEKVRAIALISVKAAGMST